MVRILLAGILGGIVAFNCGYVEHMIFGLVERKMSPPPDEAALIEFLKSQNIKPGVYGFPDVPRDTPSDQAEKVREEINERYKQGPNGLLFIGPTGEEMMSPRELAMEALSNMGVALIAAWIVSLLATGTQFVTRWLVVLLIGVASWLSIDASYGIWYRFPWPFLLDQLLCALFEWGVAGLLIAAIARPRTAST
jgi:hypothetical protein